MMNYQERVQALAEKMAKNEYEKDPDTKFSYSKGHIKISWQQHSQKQEMIHQCMDCARIAVAEMAKEVRQALYDHNITNGVNYRTNYLKGKGLIPSAQEGGSDERV